MPTYAHAHAHRAENLCVPANVRQRLPSAAETDGYAAELSLLTRVARSINTSAQHTHTTSRVPASKKKRRRVIHTFHDKRRPQSLTPAHTVEGLAGGGVW